MCSSSWKVSESHCCCLVAQLCSSRCDPMDCNPSGSSVHGITLARILEWVAISSTRGSSKYRDWTHLLHCRWILYRWATGEALWIPHYWDFLEAPSRRHEWLLTLFLAPLPSVENGRVGLEIPSFQSWLGFSGDHSPGAHTESSH